MENRIILRVIKGLPHAVAAANVVRPDETIICLDDESFDFFKSIGLENQILRRDEFLNPFHSKMYFLLEYSIDNPNTEIIFIDAFIRILEPEYYDLLEYDKSTPGVYCPIYWNVFRDEIQGEKTTMPLAKVLIAKNCDTHMLGEYVFNASKKRLFREGKFSYYNSRDKGYGIEEQVLENSFFVHTDSDWEYNVTLFDNIRVGHMSLFDNILADNEELHLKYFDVLKDKYSKDELLASSKYAKPIEQKETLEECPSNPEPEKVDTPKEPEKPKHNYIHKDCAMDKRLEIMWDEYNNHIMLSRCCYTYPFESIPIDEFLAIDDIIAYSCQERKHKLKESAIGYCAASCNIKPEIKVVTVGLSRACNLKCYNCFFKEHKDTTELKELYFATLERIKGHQLDIIHMQSSGEVFFYYYRIVEYLKSLTLNDTKEVNFQTNGLLLSEERLRELNEISKNTGIKFTFSYSIDAISADTYKEVRGGDFTKIMNVFEKTLEIFGKDNVLCSFTIKQPNMHEAKYFRKYFIDNYNFYGAYLSYDLFDPSCHELLDTLSQEEIC